MLARVRKDIPLHDCRLRPGFGEYYKSMCMFSRIKSSYRGLECKFYASEGEPGFYWLEGTTCLFHEDWLEFDNLETVVTDDEAFIGEDQ